jgi:hypothetical protein
MLLTVCSGSGGDGGSASDFPDDYEYPIQKDFYSNCDATYNSLEDLENRKDKIPEHCMYIYIAKVEAKIMSDALRTYDELMEDGYDDKFKTFEAYVREQVPDQINAFMANGKAGDYFKCEETGIRNCCGTCRYFCEEEDIETCDDSPDCKTGQGTFEITCPTEFEFGEVGNWLSQDVAPNTTYTMENENGFYTAIFDDYGIERDWIKFGDTHVYLNNGCQYSDDVNKCQRENDHWYWNYPKAADNIEVDNPKDVVGDSNDESKDLLDRLNVLITMATFDEIEDPADLVDAAMLPALSIQSGIQNMEKVAKKAEEIEKAERQEMILNFISGFLFFVPFVGSAAGSVGMASVRAILSMLNVVGEAGLLTYAVVDDPDNAFMTIFSSLAGAGLGRGGGWGKAAKSKRDMPQKDLEALGDVKTKVDRFEDVKSPSCRI